MRIAILADIHGNLPALEAVVRDLKGQRPDQVYVAGDMINRCPWSNEVLDLVAEAGWPALAGNHERVVQMLGAANCPAIFYDRERYADLWWTRGQLTPRHLDDLDCLPDQLLISHGASPMILLVHGVPGDPYVGFTPAMSESRMARYLTGVAAPVVIGAHTHRPLDRLAAGRRVLNPGSVGMPYNGDPRAQYLLLDAAGDGNSDGWRPSFRRVAYDREVVRQAFAGQGLVDAYGPLGPLYLLTLESAEPWVSDFMRWVQHKAADAPRELARAVKVYLAQHGPGHWAFATDEA
jgi:predicted phosphodiesterase